MVGLKTKTSTSAKVERLKKQMIDAKTTVPIHFKIDHALHIKLKVKTTLEKTSMTEVITRLIEQYVKDRN